MNDELFLKDYNIVGVVVFLSFQFKFSPLKLYKNFD